MMAHAMSRRRLFVVTAGAVGLGALRVEAADLDPAPAKIQAFYDTLLACMKGAQDLGVQGRFEKLNPVVQQTFDLATMTRIACGPAWAKMTPDKQQAMIAAFKRMTVTSYASQFSSYNGQQFVVEPKATPRNADLIVRSKMMRASGDPVAFNYLMRGSGADWKAVDVYLDGTISQLAVRRSEFSAILNSEGPDGLLAKLKTQSDGLLKGA